LSHSQPGLHATLACRIQGCLPWQRNTVCRLTTRPILSWRCGGVCRWPARTAASELLRKRRACSGCL